MEMENTSTAKLLFKLSPPVMLALLIQSIYNIVDSFFVARFSADGLAALSIIYPIQLLMTAVATGTGAGVNLLVSRMDGSGEKEQQHTVIKSGLFLAVFHFVLFAVLALLFSNQYFLASSSIAEVQEAGITYTKIVFLGALGLFVESICTKILQARGNMTIPMAAQVTGAVTNVILDPILIFGLGGLPKLGIAGAAIATVIGQWLAMFITLIAVIRSDTIRGKVSLRTCLEIYRNGSGSIITQSLYTLYILGLNLILKGFTEDAVTVLGLYYKLQSFFFIPLLGFQQVLLPVISFQYGAGNAGRTREILKTAIGFCCGMMVLATAVFLMIPEPLLRIFSSKQEILSIGSQALRVISLSFVPAGFTIAATSYLQGIGRMRASIFIIVLRQVFLLVPLAWLFHFWGLAAVWWTFPATEVIAVLACIKFCRIRIAIPASLSYNRRRSSNYKHSGGQNHA